MSGRTIAHKAFDAALERELPKVIRVAKHKAGQIKEPADLWALEHYPTHHRKEIDHKYDYRYSQLDPVFGRPLKEKWVDEEDLRSGPSVLKPSYSLERNRRPEGLGRSRLCSSLSSRRAWDLTVPIKVLAYMDDDSDPHGILAHLALAVHPYRELVERAVNE